MLAITHHTPAIPDTSVSLYGLMESSNIIRGFSASQVSSSYRAYAPLVNANPLADDNGITGYTVQRGSPTTGKKGQTSTFGGSSWDDKSSPGGHLAAVTKARLRRYSSEGISESCSPGRAASPDIEVEPMAIKPNKEGTSNDDAATKSDGEEFPEHLFNDYCCSSPWEDTVSKSGLSSVDEKSLFPRADLQPEIVSRPSQLAAMMYGASPSTVDRAKAITPGQSKLSPAYQRLHRPPHGPSLKSSQDDDYRNTLIRRGLDIPCSKLDTDTPPCFSVAILPKPAPRNILVDEVSESLRCHLQWEHQQQNTTTNAVLNRRHKLNNMVDLKEYPSSLKCNHESENSGQGDNVASGSSMGTEQSHENDVRNHYFDSDM